MTGPLGGGNDGIGRRTEDDPNLVMAPAFSKRPGQQIATRQDGNSYALAAGEPPRVMPQGTVRRLTPIECERLQGLPDGWTAVDGEGEYEWTGERWKRTSGTPDGKRYQAVGDAVTANVAEWIGRRVLRALDQKEGPQA